MDERNHHIQYPPPVMPLCLVLSEKTPHSNTVMLLRGGGWLLLSRVSTDCQREGVHFNFKGSNSRVILPMRSAWVVPCKQALCNDLINVLPVLAKHSIVNKSWDKSLMIDYNLEPFANSPVLQFGAPPAIDSGEAKMRTASWENVDK